ncbi:transglycosylase domain-containing protein [Devosia nitrariae]|uniref:Biosynthetic peptidoglycan transglycosylase n=1 Tax=Devosia nitrariae TaxID=2071872 RepID=A0ABQ5W3I2_9HYPH|nr:transglycosylase domain-containing protein [Devosia nitrariae]GLQ54220.1 monofunctional biosynthetic peptidoglycan transglycosylase [Devosia nitrariae]
MAERRKHKRPLRRALGWVATVLAVLAAIPLILTPLYIVVDPVSAPMLTRYLTGQPVRREWRDISDISDRLKAAVVMSEDGQFCRHWGIDLAALQTEIEDFFAGRPTRGASTITMQVARNLFLWNDRSVIRKGLEVPLAVYIDLVLSKERILEIYLNIAEWGPDGEFGVVAGAQAGFGIEPQNLPWDRASLLVTALPNPHVRLPGNPGPNVRRIAGIIEERAREYGQRAACVSPQLRLEL